MRLIVNPHKIEIIKDELVNEREIDISKCTFDFAEEITQEYVKEAYFTYNGETYKQIINNNECAFPSEVLQQKGMIEIGVVAYLVENNTEIKRYNPSPAYFNTLQGSLRSAENSEPITPSEMEQFEQQLQNGLNSIDDKLDEVDTKMETVDTKVNEIDTAIEETNNLDLDVNKQNNKTTVTLTKKNGSTKSVDVLDGTDGQDGTSLQFMWQGTSLGIKTDDMQDYVFVDLQGVQGPIGETGAPFTIKKTYSSIAEMNADFDNMELGDYVMIASSVELEDNAKLFTKGESAWIFITDFSGAMGIRGETGLTPNIQIGTVVTGETSSVTRTGTNENPIFNFVLEKGETGATGSTGATGATGNGIASVVKTSTSGLVDTYTVTYTNGNTSTFTVTNGKGITSIAKTSTDGLIDTYTITYNDNTTSTFTVTNGKGISSIAKTGTSGLVDTYTVTFNDNTTMTYTVTNGKDGIDGEVTQEQLDQVIKDLEYWKTTNNALPKVEDEDTDITLNNTADSPLTLGFKASESIQDSTPTPEYRQDIHVVKGDNEIVIRSKSTINIYDKNNPNNLNSYYLNSKIISNNETGARSIYVKCEPNITYTISKNAGKTFRYATTNEIPANNVSVISSSANHEATSMTITTESNANYIWVNYYNSGNGDTGEYTTMRDSIKIETSVTPKEQNYPLTLDNLELCNINNYADEFFKNVSECEYYDNTLEYGKWYKYSRIGEVVLNGSETYINKNITDNNLLFQTTISTSINNSNIKSNYFTENTNLWSTDTEGMGFYDKVLRMRIKSSLLANITTSENAINSFKNWLSTHNTIVYYILATPTKTLLSDTLQDELDNIYYAMAYQGQTNISQVNDDRPFVISAKTVRDMSSIFDLIETE